MAARFEQEAIEETYRVYVTDSLRNIPQHKYKLTRYYEILHPQPEVNGDEIAADIISRGGLTIA